MTLDGRVDICGRRAPVSWALVADLCRHYGPRLVGAYVFGSLLEEGNAP